MADPKNGNLQKQEHLPAELLEKFLQLQEKEIDNRSIELKMRSQSDANHFEYAKISLQAQAMDLQKNREEESRRYKWMFWFLAFLIATVLIFSGYAFSIGKEKDVIELFKLLFTVVSVAFGSYHWGKSGNPASGNNKPEE